MPDLFAAAVPLADQVEEIERELRQRERVYPKLIARGMLSKMRAELQTARLQAALETLQRLQGTGE